MKLSILFVSFFSLLFMGGGLLWAAPGDLACRGALTKLTRAQDAVQAKEREVRQAESTTKVAFATLEVCKHNMIVNQTTLQDCLTYQSEVPRKVRDLAQVETELQDAIHYFQTVFEQMSRVCLKPPSTTIGS